MQIKEGKGKMFKERKEGRGNGNKTEMNRKRKTILPT